MTDQANTQDIANVIDLNNLGRKAVDMWKSGDKGDALAIYVLFQAWITKTFKAVELDSKKAVIRTVSFDLDDYNSETFLDKYKGTDGKANGKLKAAMTYAIIETLFGITKDNVTNAHKQRIQRAMKTAQWLIEQEYAETDVSLSRRNNLVVPFQAMHDEPGEKAGQNEKKLYDNNFGEAWEIDSKKGNSLAELARRTRPETAKGSDAKKDDSSKTASFNASVDFVSGVIQSLMNEKYDGPALNNDSRRKLFELNSVIAGYFKADPMEQADKKAPKKEATAK